MALHRDIFWIGRQWAVTGHGMQLIDQRLMGAFDIEVARLWDDDLIARSGLGFDVRFDRLEDLNVLVVRLVGLVARVLESEPVLLGLPVACKQKHRTCIRGLNGEQEVQQDERLGVEMEEQDGVADEPDGNRNRLHDQERPRADACRDPVGQPLPERGLVVVQLIDGMFVRGTLRTANAQRMLQRVGGRFAGCGS